MNIISLFESFVNHLNEICKNNSFLHELEHNISNSTNTLNLDVLRNILASLDLKYNVEHTIDNSNFTIKDNYRLDYFLSKRI